MSTHTYVALEVSSAAYDEIRQKLKAAGYEHAFHEDGLIDMHGLALSTGAAESDELPPCGGSRCRRADNGEWIHSSKSYGSCLARID
jgi:hypothetical protein